MTERLRTLLFLSRRNYEEDASREIEELKQELKSKKEKVKTYSDLELVKQEHNYYNEKLNHVLLVRDLPQELFANKTIMKELNDTYQVGAWGAIIR